MRILLVGIGAMGGVIAGRLLHHGVDVTLWTGRPATTAHLRQHGLCVRAPEGDVKVACADIVTDANDLDDRRFDSIWLLTKATELDTVVPQVAPLLSDAPDAHVLCLQNGMVEGRVEQLLDDTLGPAPRRHQRVLAGIMGWGGTLHEVGVYERTSPGATYIGEVEGEVTPRVNAVADAMRHATAVTTSANMQGVLWSKLAVNCTVTTVGALSGETLGQLLRRRRVRLVFLRLYKEVIDLALAQGVHLENVGAPPLLLYANGWLKALVSDVALRLVGLKYKDTRASMLQSLERGRPTEIDFLNGFVVREAQRLQQTAPTHTKLVAAIGAVERGDAQLGLTTLQAFCDDVLGEVA